DSWIAKSVYVFPGATWGALGWMRGWEEAGEFAVADEWFKRLIEEGPAPHYYRIEYGYFLTRNGRFAEALAQLERGIGDAPLSSADRLATRNQALLEQLRQVSSAR